jgi:hypothetical protein
VAFSFKMDEVGGADENLAAFRSMDGGMTFRFQQVIALKNQTLPAAQRGGAEKCTSATCTTA